MRFCALGRCNSGYEKEKMVTVGLLIFLVLSLLFASNVKAAEENLEKNSVSIHVEHGIALPWEEPGFRIYLEGWGSKTNLSVFIIDSEAKEIEVISPDKNITSGEDGKAVFDISYALKGMAPGVCIIVVAGPLGVHYIIDEIPEVIAPSQENEDWILRFGGKPAEDDISWPEANVEEGYLQE